MFWEARVRHSGNMVNPSELVLGNEGSDGGGVSLLQDAGVGALVLPTNTEDFLEASLMVCLKCLLYVVQASDPYRRVGSTTLYRRGFWYLLGDHGPQRLSS